MIKVGEYNNEIPDAEAFKKQRLLWRENASKDPNLREQSVKLIELADKYKYGYHWEWCGVPIIRHPDDIVLQQEIMWELKPKKVIETGVARGGSLVLSNSLIHMYSQNGSVLGIDIQILSHAKESLNEWTTRGEIELFEGSSIGNQAEIKIGEFLKNHKDPILVVLDSNHSHEHVLAELHLFKDILPVGSIIMVADTIISEMPDTYYVDRPWDKYSNPLTALNEFLDKSPEFEVDSRWSRRSLMGEFRDGVVVKTSISPS